jgi:hypothetical protein
MGLEEFTSDDDTSTSSSTSSSSSTTQQTRKDNSPSYAEQCFSDRPKDTPRSIKYWIKGNGKKWVKMFSTKRFDEGELVMYSIGSRSKKSGVAAMVFTSILSSVDQPDSVSNEDIKVTVWDFEAGEEVGDPIYVSPSDDWANKLKQACMEKINEAQEVAEQ